MHNRWADYIGLLFFGLLPLAAQGIALAFTGKFTGWVVLFQSPELVFLSVILNANTVLGIQGLRKNWITTLINVSSIVWAVIGAFGYFAIRLAAETTPKLALQGVEILTGTVFGLSLLISAIGVNLLIRTSPPLEG